MQSFSFAEMQPLLPPIIAQPQRFRNAKVLFQLPVFFIFLCQHPEVILAFCLFQRSRFLLQRLLLPLLPAAPLFPLCSLLLKPHLQRPAAFA